MPETKTLLWSLHPDGRFSAEENGYELTFDQAKNCLEISTVDYHAGVLRLNSKVLFPGSMNSVKKPEKQVPCGRFYGQRYSVCSDTGETDDRGVPGKGRMENRGVTPAKPVSRA